MVSFNIWRIDPCSPIGGQTGAPVLSNIYAEKSPPKSIISDAKKSQIPSFEKAPVVHRGPYEYSVPGDKADFTPQTKS
jgi:hypothetical protein